MATFQEIIQDELCLKPNIFDQAGWYFTPLFAMAKAMRTSLFATAMSATILGFPFSTSRAYISLQALLALMALQLHMYKCFRILPMPILHIRDRPLTELPDSYILGHIPR